jgi:hypothetical protein
VLRERERASFIDYWMWGMNRLDYIYWMLGSGSPPLTKFLEDLGICLIIWRISVFSSKIGCAK